MDNVICLIDLACEYNPASANPQDEDMLSKAEASTSAKVYKCTEEAYKSALRNLPSKIDLGHDDFHILKKLSPAIHTEALAYILASILKRIEEFNKAESTWGSLLPILYSFATEYSPESFHDQTAKLFSIAQSIDKIIDKNEHSNFLNASQSTRILSILVARGNFGLKLTKLHPIALKHAILSKMYRYILPLAKLDPTSVILQAPLETSDYSLYFYYAGLIHLNLSLYSEALSLFEQTLVIPFSNSSERPLEFQVQAYYKYILCGLILTGNKLPLPNAAPQSILAFTKTFDLLIGSLIGGDILKFFKAFNSCSGLEKAGNLGLAKRCIKSQIFKIIEKLPDFYMKLSLRDISNQLGSHLHPSLINMLLYLVGEGRLNAEIVDFTESGSGMVYLSDAPEEFYNADEISTFLRLHECIKSTDDLARITKNLSNDFVLEYGKDVKNKSKSYNSTDFFKSSIFD